MKSIFPFVCLAVFVSLSAHADSRSFGCKLYANNRALYQMRIQEFRNKIHANEIQIHQFQQQLVNCRANCEALGSQIRTLQEQNDYLLNGRSNSYPRAIMNGVIQGATRKPPSDSIRGAEEEVKKADELLTLNRCRK